MHMHASSTSITKNLTESKNDVNQVVTYGSVTTKMHPGSPPACGP